LKIQPGHDDFIGREEFFSTVEDAMAVEWWLTFPQNIIEQRLELWLRFPSVKRGYVRILDPQGFIEAEVPAFHLEAMLQGFDTPHRFYHRGQWRDFLRAAVADRDLHELPVSASVN
jgi:hypothetical protein